MYIVRSTQNLFKRDVGQIVDRFRIIPWSSIKLIEPANISALAMIPIDLLVPMPRLKPENRLLIMCHLGLHFLTSSSPALARVATQAGVNSACEKEYAWLINFNRLLKDPDFAHNEIVRGENYVRDNHSKATTQQVGFVRSIGDGLINVQRQLFFPWE